MKLSITGMGVVSPAGVGKDDFFDSLTNGRTGIDHWNGNPFAGKAGVVKDFSVRPYTKNFKQNRPLARVSHLAIAATKMAAEDGGFFLREQDSYRTGMIVGTNEQFDDSSTLSVIKAYEKSLNDDGEVDPAILGGRGLRELPAKYILQVTPNIVTFACSYELSLNGYSNTLTSGSNASFDVLLEVEQARKRGMADSFFCGASDCLLNPMDSIGLVHGGKEAGVADTAVPGEGAVFFQVDDSSKLDRQNAKVYAEVVSCSGLLFRHNEDLTRVIDDALAGANITAIEVDAVVLAEGAASGFSRPALETLAGSFSKKKGLIPVCSPLPYMGYTRAAAGAFGMAMGIYILQTGKIPPMLLPVDTSFCQPLSCEEMICRKGKFSTVLVINVGLTGCVHCAVMRKPQR